MVAFQNTQRRRGKARQTANHCLTAVAEVVPTGTVEGELGVWGRLQEVTGPGDAGGEEARPPALLTTGQ